MDTKRKDSPLRAALFLTLLLLSACSGSHPEQAWLTGRWQPVHNPLHDNNDTLVFRENGTVTVETTDNRNIEGTFRIKDKFLILTLSVPKRPTEVRLMIDPKKKRLMYKNGAYFERRQSP